MRVKIKMTRIYFKKEIVEVKVNHQQWKKKI